MGRKLSSFSKVIGALLVCAAPVCADVTSLTLTSSTVASCQDYFTSEWGEPLDMSAPGDILENIIPREKQQLGTYSYGGGLFSTTTTGVDPYFRILTWTDGAAYDGNGNPGESAISDTTTRFGLLHPIKLSTFPYRVLSFRMYTDIASDFQVYWDNRGGWGISNPIATTVGWNTYQIDLGSVGINDHSASHYTYGTEETIGLRIDPNRNNPNANISIDWMQLTPAAASCANATVNYANSGTANGDRVSIFVDSNNNPYDGYYYRSSPQSGAVGSVSFNSNAFFPGTHKVYSFASNDFATSYLNPWDMSSSADVSLSQIYNITNTSFSNGKFCGTATTTDANFYMALPAGSSIDASVYNKFSVAVEYPAGLNPSPIDFNLFYFDTNGALKGAQSVSVNGNGTYNIDLSGAAGWNGQIGGIRLSPLGYLSTAGQQFCVDWVSLSSTNFNGSLSTPTIVNASSDLVFTPRGVTKFLQPDNQGGEDYFVAVKGNPNNMADTADIQHLSGIASAYIYPGNVYTDSNGAVRTGDFLQATNISGNDDPQTFSVFVDNANRIDPSRYKVACFDLDVLASTSIYHSVARILWTHDGLPQDGDDLVLATTGERKYCLRMDTMKMDDGSPPKWQNNTDGTGINYWRVDAHEETTSTTFRFGDIRLAADHEADQKFAIVLEDDRSMDIDVYFTSAMTATGGTLIDRVAAGRNSDVLLWNTSGVAAGTYRIYATIGSNSFLAPGPIVVRHDTIGNDSTAPILSLDAPLNGHVFTNSLQIAGYALDNRRIANIEVFLDGQLKKSFRPTDFRKAARDLYPNYPYTSSSGFNFALDLSAAAMGSHTFRIDVYDTSGNKTSSTSTISRAVSDPTADVSYDVPNETPVVLVASTPTPVPSGNISFSTSISKGKTISFKIKNATSCSSVSIVGNSGKNKTAAKILGKGAVSIFTVTPNGSGSVTKTSPLKSLKTPTSAVHFLAYCNSNTSKGKIKSVLGKSITASGPKVTEKGLLNLIKKKVK